MTGDERVRHCHACQLNIYNTAEMTASEVQSLIENREGRLCIRMYRRADGTVLTKDCPVGLRAVKRRISRVAAAAFGAVLGLVSVSFGQKDDEKCGESCELKIVRQNKLSEPNSIIGTVSDENGAVIPGAVLRLYGGIGKQEFKVTTNSDGEFSILGIPQGDYTINSKVSGFSELKKKRLSIGNNEQLTLNLVLKVSSGSVTVGIFGDDDRPSIDPGKTSITETIYRRKDN